MTKYVGKAIPKLDSKAITTGRPIYTEDFADPNALIIHMKYCPHAHARIASIDVSKAKLVPGVVDVYTYEDVPQIRYTNAGKSFPDPYPYDRLLLDRELRYAGDPVAIVAAETEDAADKALRLIKVKYEILPALLDPTKALDNELVVHPAGTYDDPPAPMKGYDPSRNLVSNFKINKGDFDQEWEQADYHIERDFTTQAQAPCTLETQRAYTYLDEMGRIVVYASTQVPYHARRQVARTLGLPISKVRVIKPRIGGGFGSKNVVIPERYAAFVTMKTGRPAKLVFSRRENMTSTIVRHPMRIHVRVAANKDGQIRGIDVVNINNTGAYGEDGPAVTLVAATNMLPVYNRVPAIRYDGKTLYTNLTPSGAVRGYGATQGSFAMESTLNELAEIMGIDQIEFRKKNIVQLGDSGGILPCTIRSFTLDQCIDRGRELIGWDETFPCKPIGDHKVRAVGMSIAAHDTAIPTFDKASVTVRLEDDGTFIVLSSSADVGTGSDTILCQFAAETLNVDMESIALRSGDTDGAPYDCGAYACSTTYVTGQAVIKACKLVIEKMIAAGAEMLQLPAENLEYDGDYVTSKTDPSKRVTRRQIAARSQQGTSEIVSATAAHTGETSPMPFAAGFAEIEMDTETYEVKLTNYATIIDCGKVMNPPLCRIQAEGGIVMGMGLALTEDPHYSEDGRLLTGSLMQYKIPARKDVPAKIKVEFIESYEPTGPFGAKGVGELVTHTAASAIANAVHNASGIYIRSLPITPDKIFHAVMEKKAQEGK